EQMRTLAFYDSLTKLPNRRLFLERLEHAYAAVQRLHTFGALLVVDLDNFKTLNDTEGHTAGDLLLEQVASRLVACGRQQEDGAVTSAWYCWTTAAPIRSKRHARGKRSHRMRWRRWAGPISWTRPSTAGPPASASPCSARGNPSPPPRCCATRIWPCHRPRSAAAAAGASSIPACPSRCANAARSMRVYASPWNRTSLSCTTSHRWMMTVASWVPKRWCAGCTRSRA